MKRIPRIFLSGIEIQEPNSLGSIKGSINDSFGILLGF